VVQFGENGGCGFSHLYREEIYFAESLLHLPLTRERI